MIQLVILFIISVLFNIVLLCLYAERKYSSNNKSDSGDRYDSLASDERWRLRIREAALKCKKDLEIAMSDVKNGQESHWINVDDRLPEKGKE